jgi:predicted nucleic acid-binding protein
VKFLDSNIFLYFADRSAPPVKQAVADRLVKDAIAFGDVISFQVVQETLRVALHKFAQPVRSEDARDFLETTLRPLWTVQPTVALYNRAMSIRDRYQYAFYDALIIAAALEAGCDQLLSEDLQAGQRIEGLTIVNPFV